MTPTGSDPVPPIAELGLPSGGRQAGTLGSYSYAGASADTPWLPARALTPFQLPGPDAALALTLPSPPGFSSWAVRYTDVADEAGDSPITLANGGQYVDPDVTTTSPPPAPLDGVSFNGPPAGSWVMSIYVQFADGSGEATYYWHAVVP